jgi:hypothetical protein
MSTCVCGRTTRRPLCDNSCSLSESTYQERTQRLARLYDRDSIDRVNTFKQLQDTDESNQ